jgi:hypothetical protein
MSDLNGHIRSGRKNLLKKYARLPGSPCPSGIGAEVHHNRHATLVRLAKNSLELHDVPGIVQVHIGISEMQLKAPAKSGDFRAPLDFCQRIFLQWVHSADGREPFWIQSCLFACPIVLRLYLAYSF